MVTGRNPVFNRFAIIIILLAVGCIYLIFSMFPMRRNDRPVTSKEVSVSADRISSDEHLQKIVGNLQQALKEAKEVGDKKEEASILSHIGQAYEKLGRHRECLECHYRALAVSRNILDRQGEAVGLHNIGRWFAKHGPLEKALDFHEQTLGIQNTLGDLNGQAATLNELASVYKLLEQYQRQLQCYEDILEIRKRTGDIKGWAATIEATATVHMALREYEKAQVLLETALTAQRQIEDTLGQATTLERLASLKRDQGHYSRALELIDEGLDVQTKPGDSSVSVVLLITKALTVNCLGQYENALELSAKALSSSRETGNRSFEIEALSTMAQIYCSYGFTQEALRLYENGLSLAKRNGDSIAEGRLLQAMTETYLKDGEHKKATLLYEKLITLRKELGVPTEPLIEAMAKVLLETGDTKSVRQMTGHSQLSEFVLALLDIREGEYVDALLHLSAGTEPTTDTQFVTSALKGVAYEGVGKYEDAIRSYSEAAGLLEQIREALPEAQRRNFFNTKISSIARILPYEGLCRVFLKMGNWHESFRYAEMTKARSFADFLVNTADKVTFGVPQNIQDEDREINSLLSELAIAKADMKGDFDTDHIGRIRERRGIHLRKIRKMYPVFAAVKYPQPMYLTETALNDDEWLLEYEVTDNGVMIYLTRGKQIMKALSKDVSRAALDSLIMRLRMPLENLRSDNLEDKLKSFDLSAGKKLADVLLADILEVLPPHVPVIVVPDESLGTFPFEMLVLNEQGTIKTDRDLPYVSGAEFFGDRNLVSYHQSVTALTLARLHAKSKGTESRLLVIADPVFEETDDRNASEPKEEMSGSIFAKLLWRLNLMADSPTGQVGHPCFKRLSHTGELAERLAALYDQNCDVYTGWSASKHNFLEIIGPSLVNYDKVVFATHGYLSKDMPGILEPVLILTLVPPGTDGYLRMTDVMGLKMNADIVVLTACQTGVGRQISGEGTMGMGRGFQYAGAKSILVSLWSVSEPRSVDLVKSFFSHIKEGKSKLEALDSARRELRKRFDHPFFWAGFILVGEAS